jgi:hypothetical protein
MPTLFNIFKLVDIECRIEFIFTEWALNNLWIVIFNNFIFFLNHHIFFSWLDRDYFFLHFHFSLIKMFFFFIHIPIKRLYFIITKLIKREGIFFIIRNLGFNIKITFIWFLVMRFWILDCHSIFWINFKNIKIIFLWFTFLFWYDWLKIFSCKSEFFWEKLK